MNPWITLEFVGSRTLTCHPDELFSITPYVSSPERMTPGNTQFLVNWDNVTLVREADAFECEVEKNRREGKTTYDVSQY